jgi:RNA polymerase sigma factor (sigma-70 family)
VNGDDDPAAGHGDGISAETSLALLARAKAGDADALETLLARYRPRLRRWAHRRLPAWARDLADTDDLIQDTLIKAIRNLAGFEAEASVGFQSYLRTAVGNAIRDEIRKARRRPPMDGLDPSLPSDESSPLERAVGRLRLRRYEAALAQLAPDDRDAVVARLEFGFTHGELAAALGKRTPDAARKLCHKAFTRLLTIMSDESARKT